MEQFSSKLLEDAIQSFQGLPGVGRKTATRMVLHLLKLDKSQVEQFAQSLHKLRSEIQYCGNCHNLSDQPICNICADQKRDASLLCVVEDVRDVMAIENTHQFKGVYHVLGGKISPMDGIGPSDLFIDTLTDKVNNGLVKEVILALSTTMEGETTSFYLYKKIQDAPVTISTIARGISFGDELEYADEVTLGRSILQRTPYENTLAKN
jgi:recombination protein RecR